MLIRHIPWDSQPQEAIGANPEWVSRGLVALFDQRILVDVVNGIRASSNSGVAMPSRQGIGQDYSGTANTQYPHHPAYAITGPLSIVALLEVDTLTNYNAIISKQATTTTAAPYEFRLGYGPTVAQPTLLRAGAADYREHTTTSSAIFSAPFSGTIIATYPTGITGNTGGFLYTNGVQTALNLLLGSGTVAVTDNGSSPVCIGRRAAGTTQLDGKIYYVALFNRELSASDAKAISENPWQLFESRHSYIPLNIASSGVTGTLATTNANDTVVAAGSTTIVGTLARTNADDTSAASGSTTIVGTLARTNANDTVVATGHTTVTGTLAYTNINDTSAALGSTTIIGTLARTNADDTVAASGSVGNITGTLALV